MHACVCVRERDYSDIGGQLWLRSLENMRNCLEIGTNSQKHFSRLIHSARRVCVCVRSGDKNWWSLLTSESFCTCVSLSGTESERFNITALKNQTERETMWVRVCGCFFVYWFELCKLNAECKLSSRACLTFLRPIWALTFLMYLLRILSLDLTHAVDVDNSPAGQELCYRAMLIISRRSNIV